MEKENEKLAKILKSVRSDQEYLADQLVQHFGGFKIIVNLRCGSWYVKEDQVDGACYFKSTDCHPEALKRKKMFGIRRLNMHLLGSEYQQANGLVIIDSTKNPAKNYPDSFTRTIPIWCYVINKLVEKVNEYNWNVKIQLHEHVPEQEKEHITSLLPYMVDDLSKTIGIPFASDDPLRLNFIIEQLKGIKKSLFLHWIDRESIHEFGNVKSSLPEDFFHIFLLCPSSNETLFDGYIKGAADDEESWAYQLTPHLFYSHWNRLRPSEENKHHLVELVKSIVQENKIQKDEMKSYRLQYLKEFNITVNGEKQNSFGCFALERVSDVDIFFDLSPNESLASALPSIVTNATVKYYHLPLRHYKKYSEKGVFEIHLNTILEICGKYYRQKIVPSIVIWSAPESLVSPAILLVILLTFFDLAGAYFGKN